MELKKLKQAEKQNEKIKKIQQVKQNLQRKALVDFAIYVLQKKSITEQETNDIIARYPILKKFLKNQGGKQ